MNKSLALLAGAALLMVGLPSGILPQARAATSGTFDDVPADHWAYEAVDTLQKAGIVIGYPDGTYGGKRAMTRYEFAEAIARLMPLLNTDTSNLATKDDLAAAQQDLQNKLDANSAAIAALQQLVNGFQPELTALGVDVDAIKARLDALEDRVAAVEAEQARVKINGDLNIIARGNMVSVGNSAFDENGSIIAQNNNTNSIIAAHASNRFFQADDVYNDFLLGIKGRLNDQASANILIDFGNYISEIANTVAPGDLPTFNDGKIQPGNSFPGFQQVTVWEAYLATPTGYGPLGQGDLKVGRIPVQWTKYTLKSVDADLYTHLYETDSGNIPVDGADADFHTGPISWDGWAGKFSAIPDAQPFGGAAFGALGFEDIMSFGLQPFTHAEAFDQGAGLRGTIGGVNSKFGITLEQFALNFALVDPETDFSKSEKVYNRVTVYGADYDGNLPLLRSNALGLKASYNEAAFGDGSGFNNVESGWRTAETDDQLALNFGCVALQGGYKYIGPDYSAPGYWDNIGSWINPTGIKGPVTSATIKVPHTLGLDLGWADYKTAYNRTKENDDYDLPLETGDSVTQLVAGTGVHVGGRDTFTIKYEQDNYILTRKDSHNILASGDPVQSFLTFGLDHKIDQNADLSLLYQIFTFDEDHTGFADDFIAPSNITEGETAVAQFSLHF